MDIVRQNRNRGDEPLTPLLPMSYLDFLRENPASGTLKIQAVRARGAIPMPEVEVSVFRGFDDVRVLFFEGKTDADGIIDNVRLPAPPRGQSLMADGAMHGALYQVYAAKQGFQSHIYEIEIFEGITAILPVMLRPAGEG